MPITLLLLLTEVSVCILWYSMLIVGILFWLGLNVEISAAMNIEILGIPDSQLKEFWLNESVTVGKTCALPTRLYEEIDDGHRR